MIRAAPAFRTLRTRLTVLYAGLFTVGLIALSVLAQVMIERSARSSATDELATSASVHDRLWQERERSLVGAADVVARDFGFRSAVASSDTDTIVSALDSLRGRADVPFAVLVTNEGEVIGDAGALGPTIGRFVGQIAGDRRDAVVTSGASVFRIVTAPVLAPLEIGRIAFVVPLNTAEMRGLEKLSAIPLNATMLTRLPSGAWRGGGVELAADMGRSVVHVDTPAGRSFAIVRPLAAPAGQAQAALLLSYPMVRAMAPYRSIQLGLVAAGLLWLVLIVIGTGRLARGIARPIAALDAAARRLEEGERAEVDVESDDEVGRLARSFNSMSRGIKEREQRITHLAFHDGLTDLPNRVFFQESLEQAVARANRLGEQVGVLCLDLDGFKSINDTLGHPVGDDLLRAVSEKLLHVADGCMIARLGGDEFAIVVLGSDDLDRSRRLAQAIIDAFADPLDVAGHTIATGSSIGIAMYPADGTDASVLLKNADLALYRAKQDGRGGFRFFEPSLDEAARRRRQIETDLRVAIRTGQLQLNFQPIVASDGGSIRGFEALLRWPHPERGFIPPVEFIPVAEETGLIVQLGEWVLHEACRIAAGWPENIRVAVNVSPLQFRSAGFSDVVLQALARSGLSPDRLEIEITESVFLDGETGVLQILHLLRRMGVRVALDDFGTGYSSLSYLRSFPFDKIKIDRSFVTNIAEDSTAAAIVKAIVDLATALSMETTAEGVEDRSQHAKLQAQGCSTLQGYLFSRPLDIAAVTRMLSENTKACAA
ncbi:diguanylate cyclase (GGDEF) domain-containing protein [Sphingomonas guangdongensis]|uniref:Diguanylate cyclase (GGDEF) domain-containing protein n=1 Tax=Sphingomonas guangdongensis TaxID=1141890 RepID=A0A285QYB0_9SPHN|nr:EAL domain-containing protein [Sphingomonas guangdongensis]SOB86369.1 diguanylate cyclase (GGDEF) domain-containing protein [Sphingomonas guangdongensis]